MYDILTLQEWLKQFYRVSAQDGGFYDPPLMVDSFIYPVTFTAFNAVTGNAAGNLQINANADFVLTRISYSASTGTAQTESTKTVAQVTMQITDAGSQRPFFNSAMALENFAANANPQRFLAYPKFVPANSSLSFQLQGVATAAETYRIDLALEGVSVRRYG